MKRMQKLQQLKMLENYEKKLMSQQMNVINYLFEMAKKKKRYENDSDED